MSKIFKGESFSITLNGESVPVFGKTSSDADEPKQAMPSGPISGTFTATLKSDCVLEAFIRACWAEQFGGLTYGSVCSGIEAASVAWHPLGWQPTWFAEIESFPSHLLAHHWPDVPNLGDMTKIGVRVAAGDVPAPDVLVGGTPCQAFSVAGLREGLDDERGQLTLEYMRLANAIDDRRAADGKAPVIIVWENVPGVFTDASNAFGCFLAGLAGENEPFEPGPRPATGKNSKFWRWDKNTGQHVPRWSKRGCIAGKQRKLAWRVLDAQYCNLAQRRERVFVVASARTDIYPEEILFEFDGVRRDSSPERKAPEGFTSPTANGAGSGDAGQLLPLKAYRMTAFGQYEDDETASTMKARDYKDATDLAVMGAIGFPEYMSGTQEAAAHPVSPTLQALNPTAVAYASADNVLAVRRLTPLECERLQGFPDGYTHIPVDKRMTLKTDELAYIHKHYPGISDDDARQLVADTPRYKALGNSMAVPVMQWIGARIGRAVVSATANITIPVGKGKTAVATAVTAEEKRRPFLKWAGGKFKVLDIIASWLPAGDRLIEPFVGAGSVFMNMPFRRYLLGDINPDLINLYRQLETSPDAVINTARQLVESCTSNAAYLAMREEFNGRRAHAVRHAALFLAINRTCFNGLSRYNTKGLFNVGWCKKEAPYFPTDELEDFARRRSPDREFVCGSFIETIFHAGAGDVIFCDPPYEPMPGKSGFTAYARGAFTFDHQRALVEACVAAHERGARVVITNSGSPLILHLYKNHGLDVHNFTATRSISRDASTRGDVSDIIAIL